MGTAREKSRREQRKEARLDKKKQKFDSWNQHQKFRKQKKLERSNQKSPKKSKMTFEEYPEMDLQEDVPSIEEGRKSERKHAKKLKVKDRKLRSLDNDMNILLEESASTVDYEEELHSDSEEVQEKRAKKSSSTKKRKRSILLEKEAEGDTGKIKERKKTKFEKYMEMETQKGVSSAEFDLYMEKKLAKKLKVKEGKLREYGDDLDSIVEGIPSALDSYNNGEDIDDLVSRKRSKIKKTSNRNKKMKPLVQEQEGEMDSEIANQKTEPLETLAPEAAPAPAKIPVKASKVEEAAKYVAPHLRSRLRNESEENAQIRRRIRGLLNRMSESNVESITGEISTIFCSVARSVSSQIITEEILASIAGGPRGNEQYAAVFAAFVAGMACSVGMDFAAKLLESLAKCYEEESLKEDNLSLRNLTLLLSYLFIFGVCSSELIYDFMIVLSKRLMEPDVATILTVLQCCGMNLRSDDPVAMKNFVMSVQNRANELKDSSEGQPNQCSKRMEFMLETICEIKNNKKRVKEDTPQHTRIKKWLQKLGTEDIMLRGVKWSTLLDPNKKGQWWLSGDLASSISHVEEVASTIDLESLEAQKLLQLAAAQRMNTDIRRAIFCIIMSGEDYVDAFEKLLRLDLHGKQDREIMRVLVECCLQEKVFNKYYSVLATKFCKHDNNYVTTLKYCLWDQFKELESMELMRSRNLSKFVVEMIASFSLSLTVLKKVDFSDTKQMTGKVIMHFRMLFEALFERPDSIVWNVFTRIAADPDAESLRNGVEFFIKSYVLDNDNSLVKKFKVAKKALANLQGVLM